MSKLQLPPNVKEIKKKVYSRVYNSLFFLEQEREEGHIKLSGHEFADEIARQAQQLFELEWRKNNPASIAVKSDKQVVTETTEKIEEPVEEVSTDTVKTPPKSYF